jgi:ubiquinone/menaquinone biosynthesis C-methylase UbiE
MAAQTAQNEVKSYFENVAPYWSNVYRGDGVDDSIYQERLRIALALVDRIGLPRQTPVLDVGCGAGYATVALAERGYCVEGVDAAQAMVDLARARIMRAGLESSARSRLGDVHKLTFPDAAFDLVIALGVLPWLPAITPPLHEMARVLTPGGYIVVSVDNRWGLHRFLEPFTNPLLQPAKELAKRVLRRSRQRGSRQRAPEAYTHSVLECDSQLGAVGFEKLDGITHGFGPFTFLGRQLMPRPMGLTLHRNLQGMAIRGFPVLSSSGSHYVVLGRKRNAALNGK